MRLSLVVIGSLAAVGSLGTLGCGGGQTAPAASPDQAVEAAGEGAAPTAETSGPADEASSDVNDTAGANATGPAGADSGEAAPGAAEGNSEFVLKDSEGSSRKAQGATPSKIKATKTEAAMKFVVVDKEKGPIPGIVISLTAPDGKKYVTAETDPTGYAEVLVPVGKKYDLVYLSLGRQDIAANVPVPDEPNQNIKLTLRYKRFSEPPRLVLDGVNFDTGKATLRPSSHPRLDSVVEYLTYKKSARIEISGHTDNVGNPKKNKTLSEDRAQACREYLISRGIDGGRIEARGYGDEKPIASNDSDAGRQINRRIEATEL
jgi:outer membrane protein OmpA-like peptidoglycan-associated protein